MNSACHLVLKLLQRLASIEVCNYNLHEDICAKKDVIAHLEFR